MASFMTEFLPALAEKAGELVMGMDWQELAMRKASNAASGMAKRQIKLLCRDVLLARGMSWEVHVEPLWEELTDAEDGLIAQVLESGPEALIDYVLDKLENAAGSAVEAALMLLRMKLGPPLERKPLRLKWVADVEPHLREAAASFLESPTALMDPLPILEELLDHFKQLAQEKKGAFLCAVLGFLAKPVLAKSKSGLEWQDDIEPFLLRLLDDASLGIPSSLVEFVDFAKKAFGLEMGETADDGGGSSSPLNTFKNILHPLLKQFKMFFKPWILGKFRPRVESVLASINAAAAQKAGDAAVKLLSWQEVRDLLDVALDMPELLLEDPANFLSSLTDSAGEAGKRMLISKSHQLLEPMLPDGVAWEDVEGALLMVADLEELQAILANPQDFLEALFGSAAGVGLKMAIAQSRGFIEPQLATMGLLWKDFEDAVSKISDPDELKAILDEPRAFLESLAELAGAAGVKVLIGKARPYIEPKMPAGLGWAEVEAALSRFSDLDELKAVLESPQAFLDELLDEAGAAGVKLLIAQSKPLLEPKLPSGVEWAVVESALAMISSLDELKETLANPQAFLDELLDEASAAGVKLLIAKARPYIEPRLAALGLAWERHVVPALTPLSSLDELKSVLDNPGAFLRSLANAAALTAMRVMVAKARFRIEPMLPNMVTWEDFEVAILMARPDEIKAIIANPQAFLDELLDEASAAGVKLLIAKARPYIEPRLASFGLAWELDVTPALAQLTELDALKRVLEKPEAFLSSLTNSASTAAKRVVVANARKYVEPMLAARGVVWKDVEGALLMVTDLSELKAIIARPAAFLELLLEEASGAGRKLLVAKSRSLLEPHAKSRFGLAWDSDVVPALLRLTDLGELKAVLGDPEAFLGSLINAAALEGMRILVGKAQAQIEPLLVGDLVWEDVEGALLMVTDLDELKALLASPQAFLDKLEDEASAAGRKFLVASSRPFIEPSLPSFGLAWERDVVPPLLRMTSLEELKMVLDGPEAFLGALIDSATLAGKRILTAKAKPLIASIMPSAVAWADVEGAIMILSDPEELQRVLANPQAFLDELLDEASAAGRSLLIAQAKPLVQPQLASLGLTWQSDVAPALLQLTALDELRRVLESPTAFLDGLAASASLAGQAVVSKAKRRIEPAVSNARQQSMQPRRSRPSVDDEEDVSSPLSVIGFNFSLGAFAKLSADRFIEALISLLSAVPGIGSMLQQGAEMGAGLLKAKLDEMIQDAFDHVRTLLVKLCTYVLQPFLAPIASRRGFEFDDLRPMIVALLAPADDGTEDTSLVRSLSLEETIAKALAVLGPLFVSADWDAFETGCGEFIDRLLAVSPKKLEKSALIGKVKSALRDGKKLAEYELVFETDVKPVLMGVTEKKTLARLGALDAGAEEILSLLAECSTVLMLKLARQKCIAEGLLKKRDAHVTEAHSEAAMNRALVAQSVDHVGTTITFTWQDVKEVVFSAREAKHGIEEPEEFLRRCGLVMALTPRHEAAELSV